MLTNREKKGLRFEQIIAKFLKLAGHSFLWNREKGCDFMVGHIQIEAKYSHAKIYPSWIKRDWLTRFAHGNKPKVIVINRGMKLLSKSRALLDQSKIIVLFYDELISYLERVTRLLNPIVRTTRIKKKEEEIFVYKAPGPFCPEYRWFRKYYRKLKKRLKPVKKRLFGWIPCYFCKILYSDEEISFHRYKIFPICHVCWITLKDPGYTPKKLKRFHERHQRQLDEWYKKQKKVK